jgi:hypothetical protein
MRPTRSTLLRMRSAVSERARPTVIGVLDLLADRPQPQRRDIFAAFSTLSASFVQCAVESARDCAVGSVQCAVKSMRTLIVRLGLLNLF